MSQPISIIRLPLPLGMGSVNCYLLQAGDGYVLIDTGAPNARKILRRELDSLGCRPGALNLIVLTHGDLDHIGNAAHIRTTFGSRIAMHTEDARVAEVADMFVNRSQSSFILRALVPRLIGFGKSDRFTPDVLIEDGFTLSEYGLEARAITIPGHSKGSIGILTADGNLFCGDLFDNTNKPALNSLVDDRDTAIRSAAKLSSLKIRTVYPGHGKPFSMDQLSEDRYRVA
jgi:glyoxylase-like metal-dependent hydrolase (beta-lactamase superfamily II)